MLITAQVFPQIKAFISFPRCNVDPGWLNNPDLAFCILHSNLCIYQKTWDYNSGRYRECFYPRKYDNYVYCYIYANPFYIAKP